MNTVVPVAPGFRLRARTPAKRLKFESHSRRYFDLMDSIIGRCGCEFLETVRRIAASICYRAAD
jgi:hypothetical protein